VLIAVGIWLAIGAVFGVLRARTRYRATIAAYPGLFRTEPNSVRVEAVWEALLEFLKCTALGVLSAISYLAWILLSVVLTAEDQLKRPDALGAAGFSILVWVLGLIALEDPGRLRRLR
jgi:hypothetical protein